MCTDGLGCTAVNGAVIPLSNLSDTQARSAQNERHAPRRVRCPPGVTERRRRESAAHLTSRGRRCGAVACVLRTCGRRYPLVRWAQDQTCVQPCERDDAGMWPPG